MGWFGGDAGKRQDKRIDKQTKIAYESAKDQRKYNMESEQLAYNDAVLKKTIQERNLNQQLLWQEHTAQRTWDYEAQQREAEFNAQVAAFNKSERLYEAQVGLNQRARVMADRDAYAVQRERLDAVMFQGMQADLKLSQAKADIDAQRAKLRIGAAATRTDINQQQLAATLERQQQRAKSAFDSERQLVEIMQAAGKAGARGQAGRSANKTLQAIMAAGGRAQAQLDDQILRGDSAYNLTMMGLDKSLIYSEADNQLSQNVLNTTSAYADLAHKLGVKERDATKLSISGAYERSIAKNEFDEYGANLKADAQRMTEPGFAPLPPKPLELPRPILVDPMLPREHPEVRKGAGSMGAGAAADSAQQMSAITNTFLSLGLAFLCDMRTKHEVALLEYTEVNDALSELAFSVKELREHS